MEQTDHSQELANAIQQFSDAIENMSKTLKACRADGMDDGAIRDSIIMHIPEEDHPAFMMQWPMISMMFASL